MAQSLRDRYPRRIEVLLMILASLVLLLLALSLPLMTVEKMMSWKNAYSVIAGVHGLWEQGQCALAIILFFFSIVFPVFKLAMLGFLWGVRLAEQKRQAVLHWLGILGKWSMLDVFVVATLIVLVKLGPLARIQPQRGVYWFAAAILLSVITSMYVDSLAQKQSRTVGV
jgi:paraquat-inducible protein A